MNGSLGNESAVFPFFFRGWLSKIPNFLLVRPLKLVFCGLFLLLFFINEGFNNELFLRFEIFVERVWQGRVLPSSSLTLLPVSILCRVREPHTRHHDSWMLNSEDHSFKASTVLFTFWFISTFTMWILPNVKGL